MLPDTSNLILLKSIKIIILIHIIPLFIRDTVFGFIEKLFPIVPLLDNNEDDVLLWLGNRDSFHVDNGEKTNMVGPLPTGGSFFIMEFIEFGGSRGDQSVLGRKLAEMHKAGKSSKGFGFDVENTICSTPQINTWSSDWIKFYGEHRLGYQLQLTLDQYITTTVFTLQFQFFTSTDKARRFIS
ncbi:protein-ribulosamine 3-kinase, chloroplastic [Trifolium repens]|nr:protein-ribulosamine 3-kinase, chloroplastic [Trifolium repens]